MAIEADLSKQARTKLAKARRVLGRMQATVAFFWTMIAARLTAWGTTCLPDRVPLVTPPDHGKPLFFPAV